MPLPLLLPKRPMARARFAVASEEAKGVVGARCGREKCMRPTPPHAWLKKDACTD